jgi:tRNA(Ile2)-agmatinylcytidine synthase
VYIGIDDTDSRKGMCTTYLALELVREFQNELDLIGYPRLVRLNPNIPWKTRGNGAVCVRLGTGKGTFENIGELDGRPVVMWSNEGPKRSGSPSIKQVFERVRAIIEQWAHLDEKGTDSGIFVSEKRPPIALYWKAVREVVKISEAKALLPKGSMFKGYNTGRGIIGASASVSWVPKDHTYEVLAYRKKERWGTPREVKAENVKSLDEKFPSTFNNYDIKNKHATIVPATPCPILIGIRGDDAAVLPDAMMSIHTEPKDRWVVFETNQGTDDHIVRRKRILQYQSGILRGEIRTVPRVITGGHVLFDLQVLPKGPIYTCSAYEPTKEFRRVVRALVPSDIVSIWGSRTASNPNTINIEKINIEKLAVLMTKIGNPKCPSCGKNMKSIGKGQGYRCRRCGIKDTEAGVKANIIEEKRPLYLGYYEVPICARRHLFKPLRRMNVKKNEFESISPKTI